MTMPPVAPAVDGIRARHRRDIARLAAFHRQPVEVTTILIDQRGNKGRPPDRLETVARRGRRQAVVARVDEDHPPLAIEPDIVRVQPAGDMHPARHVAGIERVVDPLVGLQHVFEPHDLVARRHGQAGRAVETQTHRLRHARLMDVDAAVGIAPDEIEQPRLVGGDRDRDIVTRQPPRQPGGD